LFNPIPSLFHCCPFSDLSFNSYHTEAFNEMGGIQKVVDRVSAALLPVHAAIGDRGILGMSLNISTT